MILIYSHISSPRLLYTCRFIFNELMGTQFVISIDSEEFKNHTGARICYSNDMNDEKALQVPDCGLIFEQGIKEQAIDCFTGEKFKAFFKSTANGYPFDIFAASFYLLSRYEEYLPHKTDMYGRYDHENSLAFKEDFLQYPVINLWVQHLAEMIKEKLPAFIPKGPAFTSIPTFDIDMAWSYRHKGLLRNIAGFLKAPSIERIKVLAGLTPDPFDAYTWLDSLHKGKKHHPLYFFLVADGRGIYDKNISPSHDAMWKLIKSHAGKYEVGIHPSWQSGDDNSLLVKEKAYLEAVTGTPVTRSRQHYIRFHLPGTYRRLIHAGITDDYSMGYGSINGFRASVASSFNWYDLENEEETDLRLHPFCFMDANAHFEQHLTPGQASAELKHYYNVCKKVNGQLITVWHNNVLGTVHEFRGWREVYEAFMNEISG